MTGFLASLPETVQFKGGNCNAKSSGSFLENHGQLFLVVFYLYSWGFWRCLDDIGAKKVDFWSDLGGLFLYC